MRNISTIAANTFREAVRDRVLYLFVGFAAVVLVGSKLFGLLTVGDETKVILDLGLAGIQVAAMLIAVFMSLILIGREIERQTVATVLSKPVARSEFLLGKYAGLVAVVLVNLVAMAVVLVLLGWAYGGRWVPAVFLGAAMTLVEMLVLSAFAVLFSVVTRPMLGSIMTLAVFVVGHLTHDLWMLTRHLSGAIAGWLIPALYYALPNLERFNFKTEIVHGLQIPWAAVAWATVYGGAYAALVLLLATWRFQRKDLV